MANQENPDNQLTSEQKKEVDLLEMAIKRLVLDEPMVATLKIWIIVASIASSFGVLINLFSLWK